MLSGGELYPFSSKTGEQITPPALFTFLSYDSHPLHPTHSFTSEGNLGTSSFLTDEELGTIEAFCRENFQLDKMANEALRSLSKRLGITTADVPKKASEFERLMDVRGCSLTLTSVAKSVICLEIAANNSQVPVDKVNYDFIFKIMSRNSPLSYT